MTTADLVVIGGGPHGLAALAALAARPEPWPGRVVVVDPSANWAAAWDEKLARLALDRLRSPQVHHPGPTPMALRDLVEALPEEDQLALRHPEDERVPTPEGMRRFLDALVATLGPVDWIQDRAAGLAVVSGAALDDATAIVELESGRKITATAVVLAHNPSTPRVPDWASDLVSAGVARHASTVDLRTEPGIGVGASGQLALELPEADTPSRHVAIVGGGLTAGSLACEVIRAGGRATLLTRRPLRARPYDVDASWLGPRRLTEFRAATQAERRALIDVARDGGTMPARVLDDLRALAATPDSGLVIREAVDVEAELRQLLAEAGVGDTGAVDPTLRPEDLGGPAGYFAPPIDTIWLATGFENDILTDPLVAPVARSLDLDVHGGLPEVTEDGRLSGSPLFVMGPYAALAVGPASRNLSGARPAARIVAAGLAERLGPRIAPAAS
jgi:glycine/D-amino acid oxidase-like deaminating enzyme